MQRSRMKRTPRSILLAASMTGQAVDLASEHFCCVSLESLLLGRARGIGADFGKYKGDNFVMTSQTQFRQLTCASFFVVAALKIRGCKDVMTGVLEVSNGTLPRLLSPQDPGIYTCRRTV